MDAYKNFAYTTVAVAPTPPTSGTSVTVPLGHGLRFPVPPFNAVIAAANEIPVVTNAEIVRVTALTSDSLTITRAQEGTPARAVVAGDQIYAGITKALLTQLAGAWTTVPFNAADFYTTGGATWTVTGSNVLTLAYALAGQTMTVAFYLQYTTLSAGSPYGLHIRLPAPFSTAREIGAPFSYDIPGTASPGILFCTVSGTTLRLQRDLAGTAWVAGTTTVAGVVSLPITP